MLYYIVAQQENSCKIKIFRAKPRIKTMLTKQRRQYILDVLKRDGQVVAKNLADELALSEDTIRRDLRDLAQEGLLQRVHGGALPASPAVVDFPQRQQIGTEAKRLIGRTAAQMIQ